MGCHFAESTRPVVISLSQHVRSRIHTKYEVGDNDLFAPSFQIKCSFGSMPFASPSSTLANTSTDVSPTRSLSGTLVSSVRAASPYIHIATLEDGYFDWRNSSFILDFRVSFLDDLATCGILYSIRLSLFIQKHPVS